MKQHNRIVILFLLSIAVSRCATTSGAQEREKPLSESELIAYYDLPDHFDKTVLRQKLYEKIKYHHHFKYSEVWELLKYTDEDPENPDHVILIYTGKSIDKEKNNRVDRNNPDYWNREHVWPKSHGFPKRSLAAYTDLHHLRPADRTVNSSRGTKGFDEGGKPQKEAPDTRTDRDSWEPRPEVRGDIARMLFYMDVRYSEKEGYDLKLVDHTRSHTGEPTLGKLCTLLKWNRNDPVTPLERRRNERIYEKQHNRNPFIDHAEWADLLWGDQCNN